MGGPEIQQDCRKSNPVLSGTRPHPSGITDQLLFETSISLLVRCRAIDLRLIHVQGRAISLT